MHLEFSQIGSFSSAIYNISKDILTFINSKKTLVAKNTEKILQRHIIAVEKWSSTVQFAGMPQMLETDIHTSSIRVTSNPRRFFSVREEIVLKEVDVIRAPGNLVVLGDPGSGKTTSVKRIIREIIHTEQPEGCLQIDFPILVIARELKAETSLLAHLCAMLGVKSQLPPAPPYIDEQGRKAFSKENAEHNELVKNYNAQNDYFEVIDEFLSNRNILIIVDGLDEVAEEFRGNIERDLEFLARHLMSGKIICTCRSGDYYTQLEGYEVFEILPLSEFEANDIIEKWCTYPEKFNKEIVEKTYADLATKPLYLCQLILIFHEYGALPESASDVYRQIVFLMMERWDRSRRLRRKTQYTKFSIDKRAQFFGKISYELYIRHGVKPFTERILIPIYFDIRKSFGLPADQAREVIEELESHYGIIVQTSHSKYDFSHLSLREYFAALDLVLHGDVRRAADLVWRFPHVVALATCLSSDAGYYLNELLEHMSNVDGVSSYSRVISSYLNRLLIERPNFSESEKLGLSVMYLISEPGEKVYWGEATSVEDSLRQLIKFEGIRESVTMILPHYELRHDGGKYEFVLRDGVYDQVPHFPANIIISERGKMLMSDLNLGWLIDV